MHCLVLRLELVPTTRPSSQTRLQGLYRAVNTVNHETPDDIRNDSSKHVELDKKLQNKYTEKVHNFGLFVEYLNCVIASNTFTFLQFKRKSLHDLELHFVRERIKQRTFKLMCYTMVCYITIYFTVNIHMLRILCTLNLPSTQSLKLRTNFQA